ncbi:MAG: hypothetical protein J6U87_06130 [Clostridia bacterium]|nr:hypothetical protein [Clostridia bacterium]
MLFPKWLGIGLLLCCGVLCGVFLAGFERAKCLQAEGFVDLIRNIRLQIDCFGTPVSKILASLDEKLYAALGAKRGAADLHAMLLSTLLLVDREFTKLLFDFAASLGTGYREEELRYCDYYLERLSPLSQKTREELEKRMRLALILPLALSGALILLLW